MNESSATTGSNTTTSNAARRSVLLVVCVSMFLAVLNASAVGVVLPEVADGLSIDTAQLVWLMTGFLLVFGVAIPFYGRGACFQEGKPTAWGPKFRHGSARR